MGCSSTKMEGPCTGCAIESAQHRLVPYDLRYRFFHTSSETRVCRHFGAVGSRGKVIESETQIGKTKSDACSRHLS